MKLALAFMMQNDFHWLGLHLPLYRASGVFDGCVALDGGSSDPSVAYVESLGVSVYHRPFAFDFGTQGNALIAACEGEGYDALLRIDPDEAMFSAGMRRVRETLEAENVLVGLPRQHFVGDRLHWKPDWSPDPQWRAWRLRQGIHYPGMKVHETPRFEIAPRRTLDDTAVLFHYGWIAPASERAYRTALYDALQRQALLPRREDYADWPQTLTGVLYNGAQPLDPNVVGKHAPYEGYDA